MILKKILGSKYNEYNYSIFVRDFLKDVSPKGMNISVSNQFSNYIKECKFLADFEDCNGKKIAILSVRIADNSNARTIQRNFVSHVLSRELFGYDAALVSFYDNNKDSWRLSLVTFDVFFEDRIRFSFKPAKRYSFVVGHGEPSRTYISQLNPIFEGGSKPTFENIKSAFGINKITDDFYYDYCICFDKLYEHLVNNEAFIKESYNVGYDSVKDFAVTFAKKTLGQIVFLFFLQKKGWLGVPLDKMWGEGNKNYFADEIKKYNGDNFFNDFLEPFFYNALNNKRDDDEYNGYKIPFLNGGLFHPIKEYDWENTNFSIPNNIWYDSSENGFFDILSQYNFTVDESDPLEQDIAVDPEMLGKIFEKLLNPEDRHSKGAHYTPREIVKYLCVETLSRRLANDLGLNYNSIKNYILYNDALEEKTLIEQNAEIIDACLSKYTILDPAVGSGAFLVGMLNEIVNLRINLGKYIPGYENRTAYALKKECIQNNLYGVDIEYDAIEIAKLRLWLSLIVDQEIKEQSDKPKPLPNLQFSLRVGNSVIDEYKGIKLWNNRWHTKNYKKGGFGVYQTNLFGVKNLEVVYNKLKLAKNRFFELNDESAKLSALKEIEGLQMDFIAATLQDEGEYDIIPEIQQMQRKNTKPFFIWQLEFEKIFEENKGFDIVVFNPPYIDSETMTKIMPDVREYCKDKYKSAKGNWDFFVIFIELAMLLSNKNGVYGFIVPNKLVSMPYSKTIRNMLLEKSVYELRDYASVEVFKEAAVYPVTVVASKQSGNESIKFEMMNDISNIAISNVIESNKLKCIESWDSMFLLNNRIEKLIDKIEGYPKLEQFVKSVNGAATVNESYKIREIITELDSTVDINDYFKLINTGTIDPYLSMWDVNNTQYIKGQFYKPIISKDYLQKNMKNRYYEAESIKIIIAGMSKKIEAFYDANAEYLAGKSTVIILGGKNTLKYLCAILNSKLIEVYYRIKYNSRRMAGGYFTISPSQISNLPIPAISKEEAKKIIDLVDLYYESEDKEKVLADIESHIIAAYGITESELDELKKYLFELEELMKKE